MNSLAGVSQLPDDEAIPLEGPRRCGGVDRHPPSPNASAVAEAMADEQATPDRTADRLRHKANRKNN